MNATRQAIGTASKAGLDVVIELLDARLPGSSSNPLLASLTTGRAALKVLNKAGPGRPAPHRALARPLQRSPTPAPSGSTRATNLPPGRFRCRELGPQPRRILSLPARAHLWHPPALGKSTLIQHLRRPPAETGDEPGITKTEQDRARGPSSTSSTPQHALAAHQSHKRLPPCNQRCRRAQCFDETEVALG